MPSRILILFTASYPFGEEEAFVSNEVPYLAEAYDEVVVVSSDSGGGPSSDLPVSVTARRYPYHLSRGDKVRALAGLLRPTVWRELRTVVARYRIAPSPPVLATVLSSWRKADGVARLIRRLGRRRPDARLHTYSYWANDTAVGVALARQRGWAERAVARAHGWDVYFERADVGFLPFRAFMAEHLDRYCFVSDHGRRYLEERLGRSWPSLVTARLGTPGAPVDEPCARRRPFTVLSCSSLIPLKRVELLARALARITFPIRWVHLGDGPTRPRLEALVETLPPNVAAELRGYLPNQEVLALYASLAPSVLVNVSEFEGLPVSMMEALSAGVPVVGTDVGGVHEIIAPEENGFLLSANPTEEEVAAALERVHGLTEEEYRNLALGARETWRRRFSAASNYRDFVQSTLAVGEPA